MEQSEPERKFVKAPFQQIDIPYLISRGKVSWNLSEMGCYKTSTALWLVEDIIASLPQSATRRSVIYVTSKTGKTPVLEALPHLLPNWRRYLLDSKGPTFLNEKANPDGPAIYLAHYELFQNRSAFAKVLTQHPFDMAVLDEAHKIKSSRSQITRAVWKLNTKYKHVMTGSPFANNIGELWSLLHWLAPTRFNSYNDFFAEYGIMEMDWSGYSKIGDGLPRDAPEKIRALIQEFGVRRTKKEVMPDLPDVYPPTKHKVTLNRIQRRMYDEFLSDMEAVDERGEHILTPIEIARLTRLRQVCAATPYKVDEYYDEIKRHRVFKIKLEEPSSKLDALMEILEDTDSPMVVFSVYNDPLTLLKERLDKKNIKYVHMVQTDTDMQRKMKVQRFQQGDAQVFMCTIRLGGESITLTRADTAMFIDRDWNPQRNEQGIARLWRAGQKNAVNVIYLEGKDTVDQKVEETVYGKMIAWNQVFNLKAG